MSDEKRRGTRTSGSSRGRIDHSHRANNSRKNDAADNTRLTKTIVKLLLAAALVLLLVAAWRNRTELSCANVAQCVRDQSAMCGSGDGFPSTINGSSAVAVSLIADGGVALLSDTSLTVYDETAREASVRAHFMSDPAMKVSGRYAALIDLGSTDYRIESVYETIATGNAENPLISCAVSHNCRYALVMQGSSRGESWLSSVEVLDRNNRSLHKWHCAEWYINDAALSPDGEYLAMSGVNASGGELTSVIIIQKVGSSEQIAQYTGSGNMYLSIEYVNNGTLFAVGTNTLTVITDNGGQRQDIPYGGSLLTFDVCCESGAAICTANETAESGSILSIYDTRGRERFKGALEFSAQTVSLSDDACAALGHGRLLTLRLDGTRLSETEANAINGGLLLDGGAAYTVDGIRISRLNVGS